ncbi:DUF4221 family protein [Algoriphagus sediminis]|uniref:DUF4221 family protein n=1 Tax=Algoriphagus sediminis TaxID=3057113 RepID=A0ABT7YBI0_9BACT|nr:DUF4221 family protein [Algoriphagus sediminis]MDN3203887.1 DUF4221 family protein [Algoriphagus sediminis]
MQRILLLALLSCAVFACSEGTNGDSETPNNILEDFSFSLDTIQIDSGEELINLANGFRTSAVTPDRKFVFLYVPQDQGLLKIDLDAARLVERFQFEEEGPDGVGNFPNNFQYLPGDEFVIASYMQAGQFNLDGKKLLDLKFAPSDIPEYESDDNSPLTNSLLLLNDGKTHVSLFGSFFQGVWDLSIIDLASKSGKLVDLPAFDFLKDYTFMNMNGTTAMVYTEQIDVYPMNDELFVSTSATSDIYLYDFESDSARLIEFPHKLTARRKSADINKEPSGDEEFNEQMETLRTQIAYKPLLWDSSSQRYYRFGDKMDPKVADDVPRTYEVFLFAYDENLNLIGETQLENLEKAPSNPFFKDGKLWSYVNIEDELGFAIMDFNFN